MGERVLTMDPEVQELLEGGSPSQELQDIESLKVDVDGRRIWLEGDLTSDMAPAVVRALLFLDGQSHDLITLCINTPGGSVSATFAIVDTVRLIASPVRTIGYGRVLSGGAIILAVGDTRLVAPSVSVMIHSAYTVVGGDGECMGSKDHAEQLEDIGYMDGLQAEVLRARTSLDPATVLDGKDHWYRGAAVVVEAGLADGILEGW